MDLTIARPRHRDRYGNLILNALSQSVIDGIQPSLRMVHLQRGQVIARHNKPLRRLLFPVTAILAIEKRSGRSRIQVMSIGDEGFAGYWLGITPEPIDLEVVCLVPGVAYEVPARTFLPAMAQQPELHRVVAEMAHATALQLEQNVVCSMIHGLAARCARVVLEVALRVGGSFRLTHEEIAAALGATRPSVTREMQTLASLGAIENRRGSIRITDRDRLASASCTCVQALALRRRQAVERARRDTS